MPLFHSYLMVDWSANSKRKRGPDSIWWAHVRNGATGIVQKCCNPPTRREAIDQISSAIRGELSGGRRVLVGFDFAFGYPEGFAEALTGSPRALAVWECLAGESGDRKQFQIADKDNNQNNRFEIAAAINAELGSARGPFWQVGLKNNRGLPGATTRQNRFPEQRVTDECAVGAKTVWQVSGPGSVGSQTLVGLPLLYRLIRDYKDQKVRVWPFDTGLCIDPDAQAVLVEIYPSLLRVQIAARQKEGEAKDRAQVRILAEAFARLDARDDLAALFRGPETLTSNERKRIGQEEDWILGLSAHPLRHAFDSEGGD